MLQLHEKQLIENRVHADLMPEIKAMIPGIIGWVLRLIFPKMEQKIIDFCKRLAEVILERRTK